MKKRYLLILPILIFSLFGCVNSLDDNDDNSYSSSGFVTARGTLCVPSRHAEQRNFVSNSASTNEIPNQVRNDVASRQAFPTAASGTLYFTLTCKGGSVTTTGTVDSSALTFTINVPVGSSTITAKAFVDSAKSQQVYEGTLSLTDVTTSTDLSSQTITLNDLQSGTDATATVSLPILINSDVTISSISAVVSTSSTTTSTTLELSSPTSGTTYYFAPTSSSDTAFSTTAASSANTVPGVYNVTFSFYATDSSSGTYLAYQIPQKITASNYLTTSTWTGIGSEPCINSSGVMEITNALCVSFLNTTFYVDSTNGSDTSVTGSFSSPFKSIQKAVNAISSVNDGTTTYKIYLKGDITATSADDDFTNGSLVEIADSANVSLVIKSYQSSIFTIDAASLGRIFYIGSGNTVTIKNVTLKNGKVTDSSATGGANGGAIFASGTFTFSGNTVVTESSDNNDVYLDNSSSSTPFITLADDFTGTSETTSARITLASYAEDYVVLSGTNVATQYEYFKVTDEGYQIGSDGKLDVKETITSMPSTTDASNYSSSNYLDSGTYAISSADDLVSLATIVNNGGLSSSNTYEFDQTADIDASSLTTSIGTSTTNCFRGTFDGGEHSISNLTISASATMTGGLFGAAKSATIKNINLKNVSCSSTSSYIGAICCNADSSTVIYNCNVESGAISTSTNYAGGIVGYNGGTIANCTNAASVSYTGSSYGTGYGGIVGTNLNGFVINCSNTGAITGTSYVGGIAGKSNGFIANSVNSGTITISSSSATSAYAGGISGEDDYNSSYGTSGFVVNCVSVGTITPYSTTSSSAGTGAISHQTTSSSFAGAVYNSYGLGFTNVTNIAESGTYSSNSAGTSYGSQILDSSTGWSSNASIDLYTMTVTRSSSSLSVSGSVGTSSSYTAVVDALNDFVTANTSFSDGTNTWTLEKWSLSSENIPTLGANSGSGGSSGGSGGSGGTASITHTTYTADGSTVIALDSSVTSFTSGVTYTISDKDALSTLASLVSGGKTGEGATFVLTSNIDLESSCPNIGTSSYPFAGTFDGNNYCVYNLTSSSNNNGLFSYAGNGATIENLRIKGTSTGTQYIGGIASNISSGDITIMNCISDVDFSTSTVSRRYCGGFIGYASTSGTIKIINCVNNGSFITSRSGNCYIAGFVGYLGSNTTTIIKNSVNNGALNSTASSCSYLAGFSNDSGSTGGTSTLTYCVNNGSITVSSSPSCIGAFTGDSYSTISYSEYNTDTEIVSGTAITAKNSTDDSSATNLTSVSTFTSSTASTIADTMNTYNDNDTDYTYVNWKTNASGLPDLDLAIEDVN